MRPAASSASSRSRSAGSPTGHRLGHRDGDLRAQAVAVLVGGGELVAQSFDLGHEPVVGADRLVALGREAAQHRLGLREALLELGVALAGGRELALGEVARLGRLVGGLLGALALAVLVVDQALAVGAGALRLGAGLLDLLADGVALGANAGEHVGLALDRVERALELPALLDLGRELLAQELGVGRLALLGRAGLGRGLAGAGQRELDDELGPDLQLGAVGVDLAALPGEGREPHAAVVGRPRLVVQDGDQPLPRVTIVQPQHGPHEAPPAQTAPVPGDLESLAHRLEPLDGEGRLGGRDIRDGSSHLAARLVHATAISTHSHRS